MILNNSSIAIKTFGSEKCPVSQVQNFAILGKVYNLSDSDASDDRALDSALG